MPKLIKFYKKISSGEKVDDYNPSSLPLAPNVSFDIDMPTPLLDDGTWDFSFMIIEGESGVFTDNPHPHKGITEDLTAIGWYQKRGLPPDPDHPVPSPEEVVTSAFSITQGKFLEENPIESVDPPEAQSTDDPRTVLTDTGNVTITAKISMVSAPNEMFVNWQIDEGENVIPDYNKLPVKQHDYVTTMAVYSAYRDPTKPINIDKWKAVVYILFGVVGDGGGVVITPGGIPIPIDPWDPSIRLSPESQDIIIAAAILEISKLGSKETSKKMKELASHIISNATKKIEKDISAKDPEEKG